MENEKQFTPDELIKAGLSANASPAPTDENAIKVAEMLARVEALETLYEDIKSVIERLMPPIRWFFNDVLKGRLGNV